MKKVETDVIPDIVMPAYKDFSKGVGGTYNNQGNLANCVYAFVTDDGNIHRINYHYCMSKLNSFPYITGYQDKKPEAVLIQMQTELNDLSRYHIYYEWLFNYSPWRSAFITKDVSAVMKSRVVVMNVDAPANLMAGACIAVRHPWESYCSWSGTVRAKMELWLRLVHEGNDPTTSFVFANQMGFDNNGHEKLQMDWLDTNDWYVSESTVGHQSMACDEWVNIQANFIEDKHDGGASYRERMKYDGPSDAWEGDRSVDTYFYDWLNGKMQEGTKKQTSPFSKKAGGSYFKLNQVVGMFKDLIPEFQTHVKETA